MYFSHGRKADDVIKEFVRTNVRPSEIEVVSSDKEIFFMQKNGVPIQSLPKISPQLLSRKFFLPNSIPKHSKIGY
ncbi:hypothetical protein LEP1GSC123_3295 [Leptospira borgpetersenii str. 200701203]|uniref:Uncharacterized protein n=1 Tax=Leptospira borgpetersenii str. 200701203 TaxID=1193007 RepID=M3FGB9_LEPBO|nr:hypothetical protein LEP1GSC123_3295 [Leptospira borgpetersenii str. 200701203]